MFNGQGRLGREKENVLKRKVFMDLLNMCGTAGQIQSIAVTECYCGYCSSSLKYHSHADLKGSSNRNKSVMTETLRGVFLYRDILKTVKQNTCITL